MAKGDSRQPVIGALIAALVASLLLVAFLLGRESGRRLPVETSDPSPLEDRGAETLSLRPESERRFETRITASPTAAGSQHRALSFASDSDEERIELGPEGRFVLSNTRSRPIHPSSAPKGSSTSQPTTSLPASQAGTTRTPNSASSAASYFAQMQAIQSSQAAANPEAFAMALVEASVRGDMRAFDTLLEDTARVQAQTRQVQAPPCCEAHHEATLQMLEESHAMLQQLRTAVTNKDLQDLSYMTAQAQSLEAKARALQNMEAQILSGH